VAGKGVAAVKSSTLFVLVLATVSLLLPAHAQKGVMRDRLPFPQANDEFSTIERMHTNPGTTTRVDPNRLQREAKELLDLSESLQTDLQRVRQGLLPKDTIEKLKRIEKLSKQLRGELGQ
jgi:hypothetical protein